MDRGLQVTTLRQLWLGALVTSSCCFVPAACVWSTCHALETVFLDGLLKAVLLFLIFRYSNFHHPLSAACAFITRSTAAVSSRHCTHRSRAAQQPFSGSLAASVLGRIEEPPCVNAIVIILVITRGSQTRGGRPKRAERGAFMIGGEPQSYRKSACRTRRRPAQLACDRLLTCLQYLHQC